MKKINKDMISFAEHLNKQFGKHGSAKREKYEQEFKAFKQEVMIQELQKEKSLTQEELAEKFRKTK